MRYSCYRTEFDAELIPQRDGPAVLYQDYEKLFSEFVGHCNCRFREPRHTCYYHGEIIEDRDRMRRALELASEWIQTIPLGHRSSQLMTLHSLILSSLGEK